MMSEEKQRRATSAQKNYLRKLGFEPWLGMKNEETSGIIAALQEGGDVMEGHWIGPPATERQLEFMTSLRIVIPDGCLKGQASWLINRS